MKAVEEKLEVLGRFKGTVTKLRSLLPLLQALTTPRRQLMAGCRLLLLSLMISRLPLEACSLKTELQEPWISRKISQPRLKSLNPMLQLKLNSSHKVTRSQQMPRHSRMSSPGSLSMSLTFRPTPRLSATNTPTMLNTGLSTELVSRNSLPGWLPQRRPPPRVFPSHQILVKSRL